MGEKESDEEEKKPNSTQKTKSPDDMRRQVERHLRKKKLDALQDMSKEDVYRLMDELQVHQIELEMQNEELSCAHDDTEEALKKYSDLYDFAPIGLFLLDKIGLILEVNLTGAMMLGVNKRALIQRRFQLFIAPDERNQFNAFRNKVLETKTKQTCEVKLLKKNEPSIHAMIEGIVVEDHQGHSPKIHIGVIDITKHKSAQEEIRKLNAGLEQRVIERTKELEAANKKLREEILERKQAEEKIRQSKIILQKIFDGIPDPLIMVDKNLVIKMLNVAAMKHYEVKDGGEIDKACYQLRGRESPCEGCDIGRIVAQGESLSFERASHIDPNRIEKVTVFPFKEEEEAMGSAIIRITDITEEKLLQKQLIQSEKLASLGLLISGIAHEINNPNSLITFNLPILRDYLNEIIPIMDEYAEAHPNYELFNMSYWKFREDLFKLLEDMEHGSHRIDGIVSKSREFTRLGEKQELHLVHIKEVIEKAIAICEGELRRKARSFEVRVPEKLNPIVTNPETLEQVLINLLINAAYALNKEDSWIRLTVFQPKKAKSPLMIELRDNGCGIDSKVLVRIFDPFYTTKPEGKGTGLGLYVSRNLIEKLGGQIEVESNIGKGSTFKVILPTINHLKNQRNNRGQLNGKFHIGRG